MQIEQHEIPLFAYHIGKSQRDNVIVSNNRNLNFKGYFSIRIKNFKTYIPWLNNPTSKNLLFRITFSTLPESWLKDVHKCHKFILVEIKNSLNVCQKWNILINYIHILILCSHHKEWSISICVDMKNDHKILSNKQSKLQSSKCSIIQVCGKKRYICNVHINIHTNFTELYLPNQKQTHRQKQRFGKKNTPMLSVVIPGEVKQEGLLCTSVYCLNFLSTLI